MAAWTTRLALAARRGLGALAAVPVLIVVRDNVGEPCVAVGPSMQPTLNPRPSDEALRKFYFARFRFCDVVWVEKSSVRAGRYQRGRVVLMRAADDPDKMIIKRLVGLEGDWVINAEGDYVHVPKGHCWIEGDNPDNSRDSNAFGTVPLALVLGHVTHVLWPPWRVQGVPARDQEGAGLSSSTGSSVRSRPYQVV